MTNKTKWIPWLIAIVVVSLGINMYFLAAHRDRGASVSMPSESSELYVCPMHPQITSNHPSDCPICGMKLVKAKDSEQSTKQEKRVAFYRSPMNPNVTSPTPRKDEMGMDFVPVYEEESLGEASTVEGRAAVSIDASRQQLIGLRTAAVARGDVSGVWRTVGRVEADPTKVSKISVKVAGYVERVFVDFVNRPVKRGEALFTFYSPELYAAQQEYLLALDSKNAKSGENDVVLATVRQKLNLWDVSEAQIKRLEETHEPLKALSFVSPVTGVVTAKEVVEGAALAPGEMAYEVTDLSTVWVMADAYQSDAAQAKEGLNGEVSLAAVPNQTFDGKVTFVDPVLDSQTLTFKMRLEVANKSGQLKPGMFAEVRFWGEARPALTIPADAVIPSGRGSYVFVATGEGRFLPRAVTLGQRSGDRIEVLDGVHEGELVVTRANFLVDSESSLRASLAAVHG